jgi:hypothetical protein
MSGIPRHVFRAPSSPPSPMVASQGVTAQYPSWVTNEIEVSIVFSMFRNERPIPPQWLRPDYEPYLRDAVQAWFRLTIPGTNNQPLPRPDRPDPLMFVPEWIEKRRAHDIATKDERKAQQRADQKMVRDFVAGFYGEPTQDKPRGGRGRRHSPQRDHSHVDTDTRPPRQKAKPPESYTVDHRPLGLLPSRETAKKLEAFGDICRVAWNLALDFSKGEYEVTKNFATAQAMYQHVRKTYTKSREAPSEAIDAVCWEVATAIRRYNTLRKTEGRIPFPAHRQWLAGGRRMHLDYIKLDVANKRIKLPKLGWIPVTGTMPREPIISGKVMQSGAHWNIVLHIRHV